MFFMVSAFAKIARAPFAFKSRFVPPLAFIEPATLVVPDAVNGNPFHLRSATDQKPAHGYAGHGCNQSGHTERALVLLAVLNSLQFTLRPPVVAFKPLQPEPHFHSVLFALLRSLPENAKKKHKRTG
jgi:hypothetical protein